MEEISKMILEVNDAKIERQKSIEHSERGGNLFPFTKKLGSLFKKAAGSTGSGASHIKGLLSLKSTPPPAPASSPILANKKNKPVVPPSA